jgi:antitoxin CptB
LWFRGGARLRYPPSAMSDLKRVRWRCRRGLMELEIILDRFLDKHYERLSVAERTAFDELLAYQDADLWALMSGETDESEQRKAQLVALLRLC